MRLPRFPDQMNRIRLYYLLLESGLGIYYTFNVVYYQQELHLTGRQIGFLGAMSPLMTLLIAPLWGSAADRRGSRLWVMRWALLGAVLSAALIALPQIFWLLLLAVAAFTFFMVAVVPLCDGVVATAALERGVAYGDLRLWGSIGFAIGTVVFGLLVAPLGLRALFPTLAVMLLLALVAGWRMVNREPPPPLGSGRMLDLLRDGPLARFLLVAGLAAIGIVMGYSYVFLHISRLGAGAGLLGVISALSAVTEALGMRYSSRLIPRLGATGVFAAGAALLALSWVAVALLTSPWPAIPVQLLNGLGIGLLWPSTVTHVAARAPAGRGASAQSLLSAIMFGVGSLAASQLGGLIFDTAGTSAVLIAAGGFTAAAVLLFLLLRGRD